MRRVVRLSAVACALTLSAYTLKVYSAGRYWQTSVRNPASAGYVALRSTADGVKGDSTVQTIYRAYGIS